MNKAEFLTALRNHLCGLPSKEVEDRLSFYNEMIEDCKEEGLSEKEAVIKIGSAEEVAAQIIAEIPFSQIVKQQLTPRRSLRAWEIVLLVLGFPVWGSLCVAGLAAIFSLWVAALSVVVCLWAVAVSFAGCAVGGVLASIYFYCTGNIAAATAVLGGAICLAGLFLFAQCGCKALTKVFFAGSKNLLVSVKKKLVKRGKAYDA